ncbi:MAG TPA: hypothetical protein VHD36_11510 [Pirellulales bacterium]|nr:hypothetical protein [Pirellulales bacterium]
MCSSLLVTAFTFACATAAKADEAVDLSRAVIVVASDATPRERKAVQMFVEEVGKRTNLRLQVDKAWPQKGTPVIAVGQETALKGLSGRFAATLSDDPAAVGGKEGYRIRVRQDAGGDAVFVLGNDERGVLFGLGRLMLALHMNPGKATLERDFDVATAPAYPLRGHQLGYRPKTNSYDAWDLKQWEQYYRDLAVFGSNAVELVPPRTDDAPDSPHFPLPQLEMMTGMSKLADDYGLDVWIWYPAMDRNYADENTVEYSLQKWAYVFQHLPRIDAVFVPGGDPGHTQPKYLMALLEKQADILHRTHPQAQMWVSPQSFNDVWFAEFIEILRRDQPSWLSGVVFGPQVRVSLPALREAVPERYPIRHYPDITHSRQCQYPVPNWDASYAVSEARECINPRPLDEAAIFRLLQPYTIGFLTYSEGCNDDVNKFIWSGLGWDPQAPVIDILRDYAGYFIGDEYRDSFAQALMALERNWRGPLVANEGVDTTLAQFRTMERDATPSVLGNWRFQQALYRAYYDAYIRERLIAENTAEDRALDRLRAAKSGETEQAMKEAEAILDAAEAPKFALDLRKRVFELGEDLYKSIRMQQSVPLYKAIAVDRGASLDTIDYPLNNRAWLKNRFATIRKKADEAARLADLREIVEWTNPGPGGFYDDLGNTARQPHLVLGEPFDRDPASLASARCGFAGPETRQGANANITGPWRTSWLDHAESLLDAPLTMRYTDLDPAAQYKLRVVYAGDGLEKKIRLQANDGIEIHPYIAKPRPIAPVEFDIPPEATRSGQLTLRWNREPGRGDNGRGCQVSEAWLMKK